MANDRKIGLLAGWGDFPLAVARQLVDQGFEVYGLGIHDHTSRQLRDYCCEYRAFGLGQMGAFVRFLQRHSITRLTMAGKIHKKKIMEKWAFFKHWPDWMFWHYFSRHFLLGTANRNDDELLLTVTRMMNDHGIAVEPATEFAPDLLCEAGQLTKRAASDLQLKDICYGWRLAKEMGRLDVGQCVVVKGRAVLAIEAIEGTDECIRRAGQLCPAGGFTVVKVAKPQQDMRFDVPTIGVGTIHTMRAAGGKVLAVEAGKTILLNRHETLALADRLGIAIVATDEAELARRAA